MTAAEIYAEVSDWPEESKAPFDYFQGTQAWYDADENLVHEYVAELAFIGSGLKWLVSLWQYPLMMVIGITKDITGWRIELRNGDWQSTGHPTPLAAVGAAVRSVKP